MRANIVLIMADDSLALTRHELALPYLHSNPQGSWVSFPNARVVTPVCTPSRASTMTGLASRRTKVSTNFFGSFQHNTRTLGPVLQRVGYHTAFFGKYANFTPDPGQYGGDFQPAGWDRWGALHGVHNSYEYDVGLNGVLTHYGSTPADYQNDVMFGFGRDVVQTAPEPFYAHLAIPNPHVPAIPAPRHVGALSPFTPPWPEHALFSDDLPSGATDPRVAEGKPAWLLNYPLRARAERAVKAQESFEAMLSVDEGIKSLIDACIARGILDRTIFVYCTDNGNLLGEHGFSGKSCPYDEALRYQLKIRWPGATQRVDPAMIANTDLAPTLAAQAGTVMPDPCDGMDAGPLIQGETAKHRDTLHIQIGEQSNAGVEVPWRAVIHNGRKYVEYPDTGEVEHYDLTVDPREHNNLGPDAKLSAVLAGVAP